jgi:hypothetical protein
MFGVGPATRIYLAAGTTNMRNGFEGLCGLVRPFPLPDTVAEFDNACSSARPAESSALQAQLPARLGGC